jgi:hypothetical protein
MKVSTMLVSLVFSTRAPVSATANQWPAWSTVEYYAELDETLVMDGWQTYLESKTKTAA